MESKSKIVKFASKLNFVFLRHLIHFTRIQIKTFKYGFSAISCVVLVYCLAFMYFVKLALTS